MDSKTEQKVESLLRRALDPAAQGTETKTSLKKAIQFLGLDLDRFIERSLGRNAVNNAYAREVDNLKRVNTTLQNKIKALESENLRLRQTQATPRAQKEVSYEDPNAAPEGVTEEEVFYQSPTRLLNYVDQYLKIIEYNQLIFHRKEQEFIKSIRAQRLLYNRDLSPKQLAWLLTIHRKIKAVTYRHSIKNPEMYPQWLTEPLVEVPSQGV